jgi:integrase
MRGHLRRRGEHSWEIKFDLGRDPVSSKRQTRYHSVKGTKREAQAELTRLLADAQKGSYVDASKETVSAFFDRWDRDWAAANVSAKTLERYRQLIKNQVRPHIGQLLIQKLQPIHLTELYAKLIRGGLAARTVGHVHRVLHRALGHAATWRLIQQNVVSLVEPPRVVSSEIEILTEDQIQTLLQKLRGRALYPLAVVGLGTGMRRGELCALRWQDVELDAAKLRVERSLEQTRTGGLRFKSPKTKYGRRTISLAPSVVAEFRAHWKAQQEQRLALGLGKAPADGLVFPTWEGEPRRPDGLTKEFIELMREIGIKATLHALRHTHASQLIAAGIDVLTISRRLGHGSPAITLGVYGHLFSNTDDRAAQAVEAVFAKARSTE